MMTVGNHRQVQASAGGLPKMTQHIRNTITINSSTIYRQHSEHSRRSRRIILKKERFMMMKSTLFDL